MTRPSNTPQNNSVAVRPPDNPSRYPGTGLSSASPHSSVIAPALTRTDCRDLAACYALLQLQGSDALSAPRASVVRTLIEAIFAGVGL